MAAPDYVQTVLFYRVVVHVEGDPPHLECHGGCGGCGGKQWGGRQPAVQEWSDLGGQGVRLQNFICAVLAILHGVFGVSSRSCNLSALLSSCCVLGRACLDCVR